MNFLQTSIPPLFHPSNAPTLLLQVVLLQFLSKIIKRFIHVVKKAKQLEVFSGDHAPFHQIIEVNDLFPKRLTINYDGHAFFYFLRLKQCEYLKQFIQCSKSPGENNQGLCKINKPEFPDKEVILISPPVGDFSALTTLAYKELDKIGYDEATKILKEYE